MSMHKDAVKLLTVAIFALFTLSACGGGGSDSGENNGGDTSGGDTTGGDTGGGDTGGDGSDDESFKDTGLVINEIMKAISLNDSDGLTDETNMSEAWLEIYNGSGESVNLDGYSLLSRGSDTQTWSFPSMSLEDGGYLRIWGSGFDRSSNLSSLHTSFPLNLSDQISLRDGDDNILDRLEIIIPTDQSWGRYPDGADTGFFYDAPTPGSANQQGTDTFSINCEYLSITAGSTYQLSVTPKTNVSWASADSALVIDGNAILKANTDGSVGVHDPIEITATDSTGFSRSCDVTIVNWMANRSSLKIASYVPVDFFLGYFDDAALYTQPGKIYHSPDSFKTTTQIGSFPATPSAPIMKQTPYGYYVSSGEQIYSSEDFNTWNNELTMRHKTLQHGFSHYHDDNSQTSYLYAGEYSTGNDDLHSVYRGTATGGNTKWESVLDWDSLSAFYSNNSNLNTIRHVHLAVTDPYTGHVWVGTGDEDQHSRLYYSKDNGDSFTLIGIGSQKFRSLSVWFTEDYVYWNMDSERAKQHVYRLPRSKFNENNAWPSLTPELSSGTTTPGIRYMVTSTNGGNFPVSTGGIYTETNSRNLSSSERAYAVEDPTYDYSESVAELTHASHWYHLWVKDQNDDDVLLMATSAEGLEVYRRDNNSRVFGFKERSDGSVDVQEVLTMPSKTPGTYNAYTQLIPGLQDDAGFIYFRGRETAQRAFQMRLNWVDQ